MGPVNAGPFISLPFIILPLLYFIKKNPTSIPPDLNILAENLLSS